MHPRFKSASLTLFSTAVLVLAWIVAGQSLHSARPAAVATDNWAYYGHDAGGMRFSPLTQINRKNVASLKVAWTFHTGDISDGSGGRKRRRQVSRKTLDPLSALPSPEKY